MPGALVSKTVISDVSSAGRRVWACCPAYIVREPCPMTDNEAAVATSHEAQNRTDGREARTADDFYHERPAAGATRV